MNRKSKIAIYGGLVATPIIFFTLNAVMRNVRYNKISKLISTLPGGANLEDFQVMQGMAFDTNYHNGGSIPNPNYLKLSNSEVIRHRDNLYRAMHGGLGLGTSEKDIEAVFSSLPDKVAISQVADGYYKRYNIGLYSDLMDELSGYGDEVYRKRIATIVDSKPNFTKY